MGIISESVSLVTEGISPIVYHATDVTKALSIVDTDQFRLSPTFTKSVETHDKYSYFMSTTRTRLGDYHSEVMGHHVLFELDGRRLSSNHPGEPMDYYDVSMRNARGGKYEQEDRVYSNKPTINNASRYIRRADIFLDGSAGRFSRTIRTLILRLKSKRIPVRLYDRRQDWLSGNTKFITVAEFLERENPPPVQRSGTGLDDFQIYSAKLAARPNSVISDIGLIYKAIVMDDRNAFSSEEWKNLQRYINHNDASSSVASEMHNAAYKKGTEQTMIKIGNFMRRQGIRTPQQLGTFLADKWHMLR